MKVDGTEIGLSFFSRLERRSQLERRQRGIDFLIEDAGKTRHGYTRYSIAVDRHCLRDSWGDSRSRLNSNRYSGESPFSVISRLLVAPLVVRSISWTNCSIFEAAPEVISC